MTTTAITDITNALRSAFRTDWTALANGVPVAPDNNPNFKPPVDSNGDPLPWLRLTIEPAIEDQNTMGVLTGGKYLIEGNVIVEVFVSLDSGTGKAYGYVDDIVTILRGKNISDIHMLDVNIIRVGDIDGIWFKVNVAVLWRHFELAA